MAIANGTCVSFKAHFVLPWVRPWTIAVNVTWMKRGFNACQTHRSTYPSIFNRFPVIQPVSSKVHHFSTFLYILAYPGYASGTVAVNVTWMERGFNVGQTHSSIYKSIFNRLPALVRYWSEISTFSYPYLHLTPPLGLFPLEFRETFGPPKTRIMGLPGSEDSLTIGWAVSTQYQRVTDRRTDRRPAYINNVRSMTDAR